MALTYSTTIDNARHIDRLTKGLRVNVVDVTIGVTSDDYSSGLTLTPSKLGMSRVADVIKATVRASSSTHSGGLHGVWDSNTDKLRLYAGSAEVAASNLANGDIVRVFAVGV